MDSNRAVKNTVVEGFKEYVIDNLSQFADNERMRVLESMQFIFHHNFLLVKEQLLDTLTHKVYYGTFDCRNGHSLLVFSKLLTQYHDQLTMRQKLGHTQMLDLNMKGLVNYASFKNSCPQLEITLARNYELMARAAQMLKIYAPFFFESHTAKDGISRQFNSFQKLTILQLLQAAHCFDTKLFSSLCHDIETLLEPLAS